VFAHFGRDKGADIPARTDYVRALQPLLARYGNERDFTLILFTLDETSYARELAPLAGHYPALRSARPGGSTTAPRACCAFLQSSIETAGFYNTVGFNDDTRAFMSIPARHDVWRRVACRFLATSVVEHKFGEDEAFELSAGPRLTGRQARLQAVAVRHAYGGEAERNSGARL
jgi:glucuronate isomerase